MEQAILTDQDNALVHADDGEEASAILPRSRARSSRPREVRHPALSGEFMATRWSMPVSAWRSRFLSWIETPDSKAISTPPISSISGACYGTLDSSSARGNDPRGRTRTSLPRNMAKARSRSVRRSGSSGASASRSAGSTSRREASSRSSGSADVRARVGIPLAGRSSASKEAAEVGRRPEPGRSRDPPSRFASSSTCGCVISSARVVREKDQ